MDALLAVEQANREAGYLEYRGQMAAAQARTQALGGLAMAGLQAGLSGAFSGLNFGGSAATSSAVAGSTAAGTTGGLGNLGGTASFMR